MWKRSDPYAKTHAHAGSHRDGYVDARRGNGLSDRRGGASAAAQDEGGFVISIGGGGRNDRPIAEAFGEQFGIDVTVSAGRGSEQTDKLLAEQSAGKYEVDVLFIDGTNGNRLIQADALMPIMDVVFHPDILDLSNWYQGRIWFGDPEEMYVINHSAAAAPLNLGMYYNTNLMTEADLDGFNSVYDYLDPQWAGKIVSLPPTIGGGVGDYVTLLLHPDVGEDWLSQYFHPDHDVFFSEDSRIVADGIANGKFHFGIALSTAGREVRSLAEAGAPIGQFVKPIRGSRYPEWVGTQRQHRGGKEPASPQLPEAIHQLVPEPGRAIGPDRAVSRGSEPYPARGHPL